VTERLYYHDSYLREFAARVTDASTDRQRIYLDRTAFYPTSGGQPFDTGSLGGVVVTEVIDEDDRIAHVLQAPLRDDEATGTIDWPRRFDHMQQHTGQHLLSAVLLELFDAPTVSFHLGAESSTIDIAAGSLESAQVRAAEDRANAIVFENRPVDVSFEHSSVDLGLRKPTEREGTVRIVSIHDLDRSACGGTHVRATGEIGPILLRKLDRMRGNVRVEFLCGGRAVARARADYDTLWAIGRSFSAPLDETPGLVAAQIAKLQEAAKTHRRLLLDLAQLRGRQAYTDTPAGSGGIRRIVRSVGSIGEDVRAEAQSFTAGERAIYIAATDQPPSIILAASPDTGVNAGEVLKSLLAKAGGRGGGNPALAQGSLPSKQAMETVLRQLTAGADQPA
jgi:alanyl-tRNA synthetase